MPLFSESPGHLRPASAGDRYRGEARGAAPSRGARCAWWVRLRAAREAAPGGAAAGRGVPHNPHSCRAPAAGAHLVGAGKTWDSPAPQHDLWPVPSAHVAEPQTVTQGAPLRLPLS